MISQHERATFEIRSLTRLDLSDVASIHIQAFPDSALTKLGKEMVRRYYEWQILGPHDAFYIGVYTQEEMLGFCFGGVFRGALWGFLERNRTFLVREVLLRPWLLFNPLFRGRVYVALRFLIRRYLFPRSNLSVDAKSSDPDRQVPLFRILSIAVTPQFHGSGAARLLMEYAERVALERSFTHIGLTVHASNKRAVRFYEKMGWQRNIYEGKWDGQMSKAVAAYNSSEPIASKPRVKNG